MVEISTSILTVEEEKSIKTFYDLEVAGTNYFHIDVMDGKFVERNTEEIMYKYASSIKQISNLPLDVHFMVEDVNANIDKYLSLEPNIITIHYEACKNNEEVFEFINKIKENNIKVGLAINPNTEVEKIKEFLPYIYLLLVMTVVPGKGGQKLMLETIDKVKELSTFIAENSLDTYIEVDGGINKETAHLVKDVGADILVAGSAIISAEDFKDIIDKLKK